MDVRREAVCFLTEQPGRTEQKKATGRGQPERQTRGNEKDKGGSEVK